MGFQLLDIATFKNMPAKSKAQFGFMGAVASGKIKKKGLSKSKAKEFLKGVHPKNLPKKKKKKGYSFKKWKKKLGVVS